MRITKVLMVITPLMALIPFAFGIMSIKAASPFLRNSVASETVALIKPTFQKLSTELALVGRRKERHCISIFNYSGYRCMYFDPSPENCSNLKYADFTNSTLVIFKENGGLRFLGESINCAFKETWEGFHNSYYFRGMMTTGSVYASVSLIMLVVLITICYCWVDSERFEPGQHRSVR